MLSKSTIEQITVHMMNLTYDDKNTILVQIFKNMNCINYA